MIQEHVSIATPAGPLPVYIARPDHQKPTPTVIVLEGKFGFDAELERITSLVAAAGLNGVAIDYLRGKHSPEEFSSTTVGEDIAAARDWLNDRPWSQHGEIATWGFGLGGSMAFISAGLPGIAAAVCFYGQAIARPLPDGAPAPIEQTEHLRAPLLLVFGGADEQVSTDDIGKIRTRLDAAGKRYEIEIYANVGHSFFRTDRGSIAAREIADAWDRVQAFLNATFR